MEGAGLWPFISWTLAIAWCFFLRLRVGARGPYKCELCSGPGTELKREQMSWLTGSGRTNRLTGSLQRSCRANSFVWDNAWVSGGQRTSVRGRLWFLPLGHVVLDALDLTVNKKQIKSALEKWRKCHHSKTLVHTWDRVKTIEESSWMCGEWFLDTND